MSRAATRLPLAALLTSSVLLASAGPASAWCRMTTSRRLPSVTTPCVLPDPDADPAEHYLEWRRPCSSIAISSAAPSADLSDAQLIEVLQRSIGTWEAVECGGSPLGIDIQVRSDASTCTAPLYRDDGGNVNALTFAPVWDEEYDPAAFALTTVWHRRSTGEILDVDMEINERRGPYGVCPATGCSDERTVDLENVLTHELGHYLGLAHTTDPDATMFASALAGEVIKRDLEADDIAGICEVYPPGSPVGECDYTPRGGLVLDCEPQSCAVGPVGAGRGRAPIALLSALAGVALLRRRQSSSRSPSRTRRATS